MAHTRGSKRRRTWNVKRPDGSSKGSTYGTVKEVRDYLAIYGKGYTAKLKKTW